MQTKIHQLRSVPVSSRTAPVQEWDSEIGSIVRLPILDDLGLRHGYHLLLQTGPREDCDPLSVLDHLIMFGPERLTAGTKAFLPFVPEMLTEDLAEVLPPDSTVLEMPASLAVTPKLFALCHTLKVAGFRFAISGVAESMQNHPLLALANYIKLDLASMEDDGGFHLRTLSKRTPAAMVALGVDSTPAHRQALAAGFKYFEGSYFCRPEPLPRAKIETDRLLHVEMLRELLNDPLRLNKLYPLVKRDASLVYRLLRHVNSPAYAIRYAINTIESAIMILGETTFRRIASIAIACALNTGRPPEILHAAEVRARFCAYAAVSCNLDANDQYFVGLLSLIPAMMGVPMEMIAPELPVREKVRNALLGIPVHERCLLDWIECHEMNNVPRRRAVAARYGLDESKLGRSYVDALEWNAAKLSMIA